MLPRRDDNSLRAWAWSGIRSHQGRRSRWYGGFLHFVQRALEKSRVGARQVMAFCEHTTEAPPAVHAGEKVQQRPHDRSDSVLCEAWAMVVPRV